MSGDPVAGQPFGGFRLIELIGRGAHGDVFRADNQPLGRDMALKVLGPWSVGYQALPRLFHHVTRVGGVEHPSILPVYETGTIDGRGYIAMRCVTGTNLAHLIKRSPLDLDELVSVGNQLAGALDALHARGLVHGDVKPANVLATFSSDASFFRIFLCDPGIDIDLPGEGGTPDYSAPELSARPHSAASDQYALGCLMFEVVTGWAPFPRQSLSETRGAHRHDQPPTVRAFRPDLDQMGDELDLVFRTALAKDPAGRYATCGTLAEAVQQVVSARHRFEPAPSPRSRAPFRPDWASSTMAPVPEAPVIFDFGRPTSAPPWGPSELAASAEGPGTQTVPPAMAAPTSVYARPPPPPPVGAPAPPVGALPPPPPPVGAPAPPVGASASPVGFLRRRRANRGGRPEPEDRSRAYAPRPTREPATMAPSSFSPPTSPPAHSVPPTLAWADPAGAAEILRSKRLHSVVSAISSPKDANPGLDIVECSVFCPERVVRGQVALVQVFAHLASQSDVAGAMAREFDDEASRRGVATLEVGLAPGTRLTFELGSRRLAILDPPQGLIWRGHPASVQFEIGIPVAQPPGPLLLTLVVSVGSAPVGHIKFKLTVVADHSDASLDPALVGDRACRYSKAFVSYASKDRKQVVERIQLLKAVGIDYFQDLDLDPGQRWERELYRNIDFCDLFLLFWSAAAKESSWVRREVEYALNKHGADEGAPPEIRPVILEGPPICPPWEELAYLHFNDRLLYVLAGEPTER